MKQINTVTAALLAIIAVLMFQLGMDWIDGDIGLHPAITFTSSVVCLLWSINIIASTWFYDQDTADQERFRKTLAKTS